jgi:hypothetical protein
MKGDFFFPAPSLSLNKEKLDRDAKSEGEHSQIFFMLVNKKINIGNWSNRLQLLRT